jgi:hypothetical protein
LALEVRIYNREDLRLYLFTPLAASVEHAVTLMPDLAAAWQGWALVAPVRRI